MEDLSQRFIRITQELRAFQFQLEQTAAPGSHPDEQSLVLDSLLHAGLIEELKGSIDQVGQFLWRYIESAAASTGTEVDYAGQSRRLQQATELLQHLRYSSKDALGFIEHVIQSVNECSRSAQTAGCPEAA